MGLWRAVLGRVRSDVSFLFGVWLLVVCAITLLAAGSLYAETVEVGSLTAALRSADPASQGIEVRASAPPAQVTALDAVISRDVRSALAATGATVALEARSGSLRPLGITGSASQQLVVLSSQENIAAHASLLSGRWPEPGKNPVEATLSEGAAAALGLAVGGTMGLADASAPGADVTRPLVSVAVTGIWRPLPDDPIWLGDRLDLTGIDSNATLTFRGPFLVSVEDVLAAGRFQQLDLHWRAVPVSSELRVDRIDAIGSGVNALLGQLRADLPADQRVTVTTGLATALASVERAILVSRSGISLLTLQFAVLAGYAVLLVGGILAERRRPEVGLLQVRGASAVHVATLAVGESLLLTVPAVLVAPWLAEGAVRALGAVGPLAASGVVTTAAVSPGTLIVAGIAGLFVALCLSLPQMTSNRDLARIRALLGRPVAQTLAQRLGIDLALAVAAIIGIWQLRLYGAPLTRDVRGSLGLDPLLVAAPALGLAAGAVLATRAVPRLAEVGERLTGRRRGMVPALGARQLARRPLRYTRAALLLMLAAALGTFATAYAATWDRSQTDQAAYSAPSDVRVIASPYSDLAPTALVDAYRAVPGVTGVLPVTRGAVDVGRAIHGAAFVALDGGAAPAVATFPADASGASLAGLLGKLRDARTAVPGVALEGNPARLGVTIDAHLQAPDGFPPLASSVSGVRITVVLVAADGKPERFSGPAALLEGDGQRVEIPLTSATGNATPPPSGPLHMESLEIVISPATDEPVLGTVDLRALAESPSASGQDWSAVPFDPGAAGWSWTRASEDQPRHSRVQPYQPPAGMPGRILIGPGDVIFPANPLVTYAVTVAAPTTEVPVAALAGTQFLDQSGTAVGDTLAVEYSFLQLQVHILGATDEFPTLDPTKPFLVFDLPSFDLAYLTLRGDTVPVSEEWLSVDPAHITTVAATLSGKPFSAKQVIVRSAVASALENDPVALGLVGALVLGSVAALAFSALGFVVTAQVSAAERTVEFALLRALGLSARQLSGWLSLEQSFLLAVGLSAGALVGVLMAWLVLPFTTLSATGAPVVPSPVIIVPWEALAAMVVVAAVLLPAAVALSARAARRVDVVRAIRTREE